LTRERFISLLEARRRRRGPQRLQRPWNALHRTLRAAIAAMLRRARLSGGDAQRWQSAKRALLQRCSVEIALAMRLIATVKQ